MQTFPKPEMAEIIHPKWELAQWQMQRTERSLRRAKSGMAATQVTIGRAKDASIIVLAAKAK